MEIEEAKRLELLLEFLEDNDFTVSYLSSIEDTTEEGFSARIRIWFKKKPEK